MKGSPRILVVGNVNVDVLLGEVPTWPTPGSEVLAERYELRVGGAAGNAALALAAMGARFEVVAGVGDDAMGAWLREALRPAGVTLHSQALSTALTVGLSHPGGERTFVSHLGHLAELPVEAVESALDRTQPGDMLLLCGYFMMPALRDRAAGLLARARARGARTFLDPGWPTEGWTQAVRAEVGRLLPLLDSYLPNLEELLGTAGEPGLDAALASTGRPRMVVKLGAAGALLATAGGRRVRASAPPTRVQDTVGAGDTFNAGLLTALQNGADLADALPPAVRAASLAIGSRPRRYPSWAEVSAHDVAGVVASPGPNGAGGA